MNRIGIIGKKGHGKDSVGDVFIEGLNYRRVAFADRIKEMVHVGLDIPREVLWGPASVKEMIHPRWGVSVRHMLQTLGTEWGRRLIHTDIWIKLALETDIPRIEKAEGEQKWIVTDVRFPNEVQLLREHGFTLVKVVRPGYDARIAEQAKKEGWEERLMEERAHASEALVDGLEYDMSIVNDGTLLDLREKTPGLLA